MREIIWRLRAMLRRGQRTAEKAEELQFHLDMEIEAGLKRGLSPEEARRAARIRAGRVAESVEAAREEMGWRWLDGSAMDFRHAWRALIRNPGFGAVATAVTATSVAIATLMFCMLEGVVLRPLPYPSPERLVRLYDSSKTAPRFPMSIGRYLEYRSSARSLESIGLYTGRDMELTATHGASQRLTGVAITSEYFSLLGKDLALGRGFEPGDLRRSGRQVIIGHRLWRNHFQSDPAIAGKVILLDRQPWTVLGVAPEGFQHVGGSYRSPLQGETVDLWLPLELDLKEAPLRAFHYTNAVARIRPGFTVGEARKELEVLAASYSQRFSKYGEWGVAVEPLLDEVTGESRKVVWLLSGAGALLLLIACANVAGLSIARAVARRDELALRRALGAGRWQLIRTGLAENLVTGAAGGGLGLAAAAAAMPLLRSLLPADFPRAHEIGVTPLAAIFAAVAALATALAAGVLAPGSSRPLEARQRVTTPRGSRRLRAVLVAGEVALAGVLCAGALYLLRSYREIAFRDHGFAPAGVLTFRISIPPPAGGKPGDIGGKLERIRENLERVPGVAAAGASTNLVWSGYDENTSFDIVGRAMTGDPEPNARFQAATAGYFEAAGMRLEAGRFFDAQRDAAGQPPSVVVNDALAERYFPAGDAVGAVLNAWGEDRLVVGVVRGLRDYPADLDIKPAFWFPISQVEFGSVFFAVRVSQGDPALLAPAVKAAVHEVDPQLPVAEVQTLERHAAAALAPREFALWLFHTFAMLALALAAAGLYALLAYVVHQRRKEIGIRLALGATRASLWRMVVFEGMLMTAAGAAAGLALIPACGVLLRSFLFNVGIWDAAAIGGPPAALFAASVAASLGPAWLSTRNDPAAALRED